MSLALLHALRDAGLRAVKRPRLAPLSTLSPSQNLPVAQAWQLPCQKLVLSFDEARPHDVVLRRWLEEGEIASLARQYPSVEFVVRTKANRPAVFKAFYGNGHARVRALHGISSGLQIWKTAEELLSQSGNRYRQLLSPSRQVISQNENPRGYWSPLHKSDNGLDDPLPRPDGKW